MDTALNPAAAPRSDARLHVLAPPSTASPQTVRVRAVFRLSEAGRRASLLTGGNGRRRQRLAFRMPASRMHLVHVDHAGTAFLKLRPRFEMRPDQRVVRIDEAPVYDAPPSVEMLLQDAARNHELEAAYRAQGVAYRSARQDVTQSWRTQVAESFLRDSAQRALVHPSPTVRRCVIATERGRLEFDAKRDRGIARDVPPEALRRFHADLRARRERAEQTIVEFHSTYAEKQRLVQEWMSDNGTSDQQARLAAGVLPLKEAVAAMTDEAFRAVDHLPRYQPDGVARLQAHLQTFPPYATATVSELSLHVSTRHLTDATTTQWAVVQKVQSAVPDARVYLRERVLSWTEDRDAPRLRVVTVAYLTGWRIDSEVLSLEWRQVDFNAGEVRLDPGRTKNGEGRTFPMTRELRQLLEAQRAITEDLQRRHDVVCRHVFHRDGRPIRSFRVAFRTACVRAGCPGRVLHDLRRTAVRNLVRAGIPERVAMQMTGHKTRSVFERYNIVSAGDLRDAGRRLDIAAGTISGTIGQNQRAGTKSGNPQVLVRQ